MEFAFLVELLLCALATATLLPVSVLLVEAVMALPAYRAREMPTVGRPTVTVLVPAHDEARILGSALRSIVPQLAAGDRLLVVADNCSDDTGAIATAAGAEVIERTDPARRGKGFALDFGVRHLERNPSEVVVIVDADCQVGAGAIDRLSRTCLATGRPAQALYLMHPTQGSLRSRIAAFAWRVKNQVRPLGYRRLELPCQLMGSGMAFPWRVLNCARLANGQLVEDLMLGLELGRRGTPPLFCPEALVTSSFPESAEGAWGQRTRWEHGHLAAIADAPRTFVQALRQRNVQLAALVADLCVPPLALLMALIVAVLASSALFAAATERLLPLWLASASLVLFAAAVLACWARHGRSVISIGSLAYAPVYALWKAPLYLKFVRRRQVEWVRTRRRGD